MGLKNKLIAGGLAALALAVSTAAASAAPAYATTNVNVRSGPGTGYGVVDTLRRGEQVDVQNCRGSWCFIEKRGPDGWVSANYLDRGRGGWNPGPTRPPRWDPPPRPPHWNPGPPRPPHWNNPRPPRWDYQRPHYPTRPGSEVCFSGPNGYFCSRN